MILFFCEHLGSRILRKKFMDIRFLTSIDKNTAYCLLKRTESGSFACLYSKV